MNRVRSVDEWVVLLSTSSGPEQEEAQEWLGDALGAEDDLLRERTAQFLLDAMVRPGAAVGPILSVLQSAWWPPPARLAEAAVRSVTTALTGLEASHPAVEDAALVLANVCRISPAQLAALEAALGHAHPAVRRAAAGAVGRVGDAAVPLLPRLVPLLKAEEDVAGAALESLGALASLAPEVATPALLEEARTAEGTRLYLALTSLRSMVEDARRKGGARPSLPDLHDAMRRALKESEPAIRVEALSLLGLTGPASPAVQEAVAGHLQDANPSVAACAAVALLRLGAPAKPPLSLLQTQLSSADAPELQGAALSALEEVEPATLGQAKGMLKTVVDTSSGPTRDAVKVLLDSLG